MVFAKSMVSMRRPEMVDFKPPSNGAVGVREVRFDRIEFTTDICGRLDESGKVLSAQDILLEL